MKNIRIFKIFLYNFKIKYPFKFFKNILQQKTFETSKRVTLSSGEFKATRYSSNIKTL